MKFFLATSLALLSLTAAEAYGLFAPRQQVANQGHNGAGSGPVSNGGGLLGLGGLVSGLLGGGSQSDGTGSLINANVGLDLLNNAGSPVRNSPSGNNPNGNNPTGNGANWNNPSGTSPSGNHQSGNNPSGNNQAGNDPNWNNPSGTSPSGNSPLIDADVAANILNQGAGGATTGISDWTGEPNSLINLDLALDVLNS